MTANKRRKKAARKRANEDGITVVHATRIRNEERAKQLDTAADRLHANSAMPGTDLFSIRPGSAGKTSATVDLSRFLDSAGSNVRFLEVDGAARPDGPMAGPVETDASPPVDEMLTQIKGNRGKSDPAALLDLARHYELVPIDTVSLLGTQDDGVARPQARQRVAAFLISWLVKVSGSEDPLQITAWLREHGRRLTAPEQLMLEMLLADPELRSEHHESSPEEDDLERYLDNVMGLIGEELAAAWPSGARYHRYVDLEQPEPRLADFTDLLCPTRLNPISLGAKGGRCAGLPACRVHCTCGGPSGPSIGVAAHLARSFGWPPLDVDELLERKGRGSGPRRTGHDGRRRQR